MLIISKWAWFILIFVYIIGEPVKSQITVDNINEAQQRLDVKNFSTEIDSEDDEEEIKVNLVNIELQSSNNNAKSTDIILQNMLLHKQLLTSKLTMKELKDSKIELENLLNQSQITNQVFTVKFSELDTKNLNLNIIVENLKLEISKLKVENGNLETENDKYKQQVKELNNDKTSLKLQTDDLRDKIENLTDTTCGLRLEKEQIMTENEILNKEKEYLNLQLDELKSECSINKNFAENITTIFLEQFQTMDAKLILLQEGINKIALRAVEEIELSTTVIADVTDSETDLSQISNQTEIESPTIEQPNNDTEFELTKIGNNYYYIETKIEVDWHTAQNTCRSNLLDLLSIETKEEQMFIEQYIKSNLNDTGFWYFWLSGSDLINEGVWMWTATNQPITYNNVNNMSNNRNSNCLALRDRRLKFKWSDYNCNDIKSFFICEKLSNK